MRDCGKYKPFGIIHERHADDKHYYSPGQLRTEEKSPEETGHAFRDLRGVEGARKGTVTAALGCRPGSSREPFGQGTFFHPPEGWRVHPVPGNSAPWAPREGWSEKGEKNRAHVTKCHTPGKADMRGKGSGLKLLQGTPPGPGQRGPCWQVREKRFIAVGEKERRVEEAPRGPPAFTLLGTRGDTPKGEQHACTWKTAYLAFLERALYNV